MVEAVSVFRCSYGRMVCIGQKKVGVDTPTFLFLFVGFVAIAITVMAAITVAILVSVAVAVLALAHVDAIDNGSKLRE